MKEPDQERSISINFENIDDAPRIPITGVYGGLANDGMVSAAFYHEQSVPEAQKITLDESMEQVNEENISGADLTRNVQVVTQLSPRAAISVGQWLIEKGLTSLREAPQPDISEVVDEISFEQNSDS